MRRRPRAPRRQAVWTAIDAEHGAFLIQRRGHEHPLIVLFVDRGRKNGREIPRFRCHRRIARLSVLDRTEQGVLLRLAFQVRSQNPFLDYTYTSTGSGRTYLYVVDATTKIPHLLQVPHWTVGVKAALAWGFQMPEKDYHPRVER